MTAKYYKHVNPLISTNLPDTTRKFYSLRVICYQLKFKTSCKQLRAVARNYIQTTTIQPKIIHELVAKQD